jgi:hypothetical protein
MASPLKSGLPRRCQLLDQTGEMLSSDPREQPMRQHRPIDRDLHSRIMPPARHDASPAITHQLVSGGIVGDHPLDAVDARSGEEDRDLAWEGGAGNGLLAGARALLWAMRMRPLMVEWP